MKSMNIAVLASGNGSNLQALIEAGEKDALGGAKIVLVAGDNPDAYALQRARRAGIKVFSAKVSSFPAREDFDDELTRQIEQSGAGLVALAGYMRLLGPRFVDRYKGRILNIHPSLLPSFKGTRGIRDAFEYGVKITGVTVHFVDAELDNGPIITQKEVPVREDDTIETLEEKIHRAEHAIYPEAVKLFVEGKLQIEGRKVIVTG